MKKLLLFLTLFVVSAYSSLTFASLNDVYDVRRDAYVDYQHALQTATKTGQNIFVIAGGNWCHYCYLFEKNLKASSLDKTIQQKFVFMKANFGEKNHNHKFFSQFPPIHSYPHLLIISSTGKLLYSQVPSDEASLKALIKKYGKSA